MLSARLSTTAFLVAASTAMSGWSGDAFANWADAFVAGSSANAARTRIKRFMEGSLGWGRPAGRSSPPHSRAGWKEGATFLSGRADTKGMKIQLHGSFRVRPTAPGGGPGRYGARPPD